MKFLNFWINTTAILIGNEESILHLAKLERRKLKKLLKFTLKEVINDVHDSKKVIFNFSKKSVLSKGPNFLATPESFEISKVLVLSKLLFCDI